MFRNIGETYTHNVKRGPIIYTGFRPNSLCGSKDLLPFARFEDEAKAVEKVRNNWALDERAGEAEVSARACDEANFSYQSDRPVNFDPGITTVFNRHNGAPVLWIH